MNRATTQPLDVVHPLPDLPRYAFVERIAALPFVDAIILYGSRARGDARPRSDIDLAVIAPSADAQQWQRIIDIVEEADTLLGVDCVRLDTLPHNDSLRRAIDADGVALYQRNAKA